MNIRNFKQKVTKIAKAGTAQAKPFLFSRPWCASVPAFFLSLQTPSMVPLVLKRVNIFMNTPWHGLFSSAGGNSRKVAHTAPLD